jgi:hypothetical protein
VELCEQIRREYEYGEGTINGVAKKLGIHRPMVRGALGEAIPRERNISTRGKPRLEPAKPFIPHITRGSRNSRRDLELAPRPGKSCPQLGFFAAFYRHINSQAMEGLRQFFRIRPGHCEAIELTSRWGIQGRMH